MPLAGRRLSYSGLVDYRQDTDKVSDTQQVEDFALRRDLPITTHMPGTPTNIQVFDRQ